MSLTALLKTLAEHFRNWKAACSLDPYFDCRQVWAFRRYYIPTKFQNQSPAREDKPQFTHRYVSKSPIIPFFMKTAFNEKKSDKFYLVLADSGMGKTTFMINLYMRYTSFFNFVGKLKSVCSRWGMTGRWNRSKKLIRMKRSDYIAAGCL